MFEDLTSPRIHPSRRALAALAALGTLSAAPAASAAPRDPAAAQALFEQGRTAAARGDWPRACSAFEQSEALDPAPGTLLNLGDCRAHLGRVTSAWRDFGEALRELPASDDRRPYAQQRLDDLAQRVPHLFVRLAPGAPPETSVHGDDVATRPATSGEPIAVDPGAWTLVVEAPGRRSKTVTLQLAEGETRRIEVGPGDPLSDASPALPAPRDSAEPAPSPPRKWGFVTAGVGGAALGVGAVTGILALTSASRYRSACGPSYACPDGASLQSAQSAANDARTFSAISTATFVAGGVLAAAGLTLLLVHPGDPRAPTSAATALGVTGAPGGAAAVWRGSF